MNLDRASVMVGVSGYASTIGLCFFHEFARALAVGISTTGAVVIYRCVEILKSRGD